MATSTQSNIGLRPTQAVTEDFGGMYLDAVQTQKQDEERKRLEEERKQARKDKFSEKYGINEDDYVLPDTEFRTINDVGLEAITQYRDLRYDVEKEFENDPTNMELKKKLGNIDNAAKRLKQATLSIQKVGEKYLKMMDEDKISGLHENKWRDILVGHDTGNMKVKIDQESANQKYVFYNEKGELAEVQTLKELMDGHIIERVDVDENIDSFMKGIGKYVVDKNTGGYIVTEDIFGQKQLDAALGQINPLLENDDTMADLYYQYTGEKSDQEENFSPQQKEQVKDWLLGKIKGRYSEKTSMQQKREPSQSSSGSGNKNITVDNLQLATDTTTNQPLIQNGKVAFTLPKGVQIGAADKYTLVDKVYLNSDNKISIEGQKRTKIQDTTGKSLKEIAQEKGIPEDSIGAMIFQEMENGKMVNYIYEDVNSVDDIDVNKLANILGASNASNLISKLKGKLPEGFKFNSNNTNTNTPVQGSTDELPE